MKPTIVLFLCCLSLCLQTHAQTRGLFVTDNQNGQAKLVSNEKRVALVVGNSNYYPNRLTNPQNDAGDMANALRQLGFEVQLLTDVSRQELLNGIRTFRNKANGSSTVALFYYAGHGVQVKGENWIVPIDANPQTETDVTTDCVALTTLTDNLSNTGANIIILDACRNNPFTYATASRSGATLGLAIPQAPSGTYIAFSTAPGTKADDGKGQRNSPYTAALLNALKQPNIPIESTFKQVRSQLKQKGQTPWENSSLTGDFYFNYQQQQPNNTVVNTNTTPKPAPRKDLPQLPEVVLVKGGTFTMGDTFGEGESDEKPTHEVTVSDFYIGKYEVTFEEYDLFCEATSKEKPSDAGWGRGKRPVINVSWDDAVAYCAWASQISGRTYRLPTEAEWEYAARGGGKKVRFGNGKNTLDPSEANFNGSADYKKDYSIVGNYQAKTMPVGSFADNSLDLYDMTGNVWEWCSDWYGSYPTGSVSNPTGSTTGFYRVLRGGSWRGSALHCRVARRNFYAPVDRGTNYGFRVVVSP